MKLMNNKGQAVFNTIASLAVGIATLGIVMTVTFLIMSAGTEQIGATEGVVCTGNSSTVAGGGGTSMACNSTHLLQSAVGTIPGWVPIIVVAGIGAALLVLVSLFRRG